MLHETDTKMAGTLN